MTFTILSILVADNTSLSLALKNPDSRAEILNNDSEGKKEEKKKIQWAKKWKVRFNEEKTEQLNLTICQYQNQLTFGSTTQKKKIKKKSHKSYKTTADI